MLSDSTAYPSKPGRPQSGRLGDHSRAFLDVTASQTILIITGHYTSAGGARSPFAGKANGVFVFRRVVPDGARGHRDDYCTAATEFPGAVLGGAGSAFDAAHSARVQPKGTPLSVSKLAADKVLRS